MTKEISTSTASKVRDKLAMIKARLEKMETNKDNNSKTNGIFRWNGRDSMPQQQTGEVQINKVTSIALLISILGFMLTRKSEYDEAAKILDLNPFPVFTWCGYNIEAWENDIRARINVITYSSEIERLKKLKDELSKYVSEEDRVNDLLNQIQDI